MSKTPLPFKSVNIMSLVISYSSDGVELTTWRKVNSTCMDTVENWSQPTFTRLALKKNIEDDCKKGDILLLLYWLHKGFVPDFNWNLIMSSLYKQNKIEYIYTLLMCGLKIRKIRNELDLLELACRDKRLDMLRMLDEARMDFTQRYDLLPLAIETGNIKIVRFVLSKGSWCLDSTQCLNTLFKSSGWYCSLFTLEFEIECIEELLNYWIKRNPNHEKSFLLNIVDKESRSAFYYLIVNRPILLGYFLKYGGTLMRMSKEESAFGIAIIHKKLDCFKLLLQHTKDQLPIEIAYWCIEENFNLGLIELKNNNFNFDTSLRYAIAKDKYKSALCLLLDCQVDPNRGCSNNGLPLHCLVNLEIIQLLKTYGADCNKEVFGIESPFERAVVMGNVEIISLMMDEVKGHEGKEGNICLFPTRIVIDNILKKPYILKVIVDKLGYLTQYAIINDSSKSLIRLARENGLLGSAIIILDNYKKYKVEDD